MARSKDLGMAGDAQGSLWCSGKQFAFISEVNPEKPSDIRLGSTFCKQNVQWKGPGPSGRCLCVVDSTGFGDLSLGLFLSSNSASISSS
jgi:hypothetical protein